MLQAYTQELVNTTHPTKKAFFKYKSVLNIIFRYACLSGYISKNPVEMINNRCYYKSCSPSPHSPEEKILSEAEIRGLRNTVRHYMGLKRYNGYFINGYAILFAIETGVRAGEIPALKWTDIKEDYIHIHAQQLYHVRKGGKQYYYAEWTKDEKQGSNGGRQFPLTEELKNILTELKGLQEGLGISSEYIFVHEDGDWIKTDAYETCLRRIMQSLGFSVTNNHSLRMSLNSNVFIPLGIPATERARMLGHSVQTNLSYYSFAGKDKNNDICCLLNNLKRHENR